MRMCENLPIMPLNAVLFPGAPTTLYIHEARYRKMLADCLADEGYLGVALLRSGKEVGGPAIPYDVGTLAHIVEATHLPDGSSIVLAQGGPRFRIDTILATVPIVRADVVLLEEDAEITVEDEDCWFRRASTSATVRLGTDGDGGGGVEPDIPHDPVQLSYATPQPSGTAASSAEMLRRLH